MTFGLRGRITVVTGGSRGFGRVIAERLASEGCDLALCARGAEALEDTARDFTEKYGVRVLTGVVDVLQPEILERFVDDAAQFLGGIDALVANAGGAFGGDLAGSTAAEWRDTFELNGGHASRAIRACLPHMQRRGGGSAVLISSISGWKPARRAQYGAAKAAQIYMATSLARELAPHHIRVNTVSPGSMLVPGGGWDRLRTEKPEIFQRFTGEFPTGELVHPDDVATIVAFLLSDHARAINGANIPVDGAQNAPSASGY